MITDYSKQESLIKTVDQKGRINIIGAGACGSWVAFILLKMGFKDIHVYDFDLIEEHNIPNQLYKESQIGQLKVRALMNIYEEFFNDDKDRLVIHTEPITEENAGMLRDVVINCVDTMSARKYIYERAYKYGRANVLIEDRLSIYGGYIYMLSKEGDVKEDKYEQTFYEDEDAEVSACGVSQTALPAAINVASIIVMQLISYYTGESFKYSIQYTIPDMYSIVED